MNEVYKISIDASSETGLSAFAQGLRNLLVKTGLRFLLYVMLGVIIFGGVGVWTGTHLMSTTAVSWPELMRLLGAIVLVLAYFVLGLLGALLLALLTTVMQGMITMKEIFHALVAPVTASIIAKIPAGQQGLALEEFRGLVETAQRRALADARQREGGIFSFFKAAYRLLMRFFLKAAHEMFLKDFMARLAQSGATHVNTLALEQYAREYFLEQFLDLLRWRVGLVRVLVVLAAGLILCVPLWLTLQ